MPNRSTWRIDGIADLDISQIQSAVKSMKTQFKNLSFPSGLDSQFLNSFNKLEKQLETVDKLTTKTYTNMGDVREAQKAFKLLSDYVKDFELNLQKIDLKKVGLSDIKIDANFSKLTSIAQQMRRAYEDLDIQLNKTRQKMTTAGFNIDDDGLEDIITQLQTGKKTIEQIRKDLESSGNVDLGIKENSQALNLFIDQLKQLQKVTRIDVGSILGEDTSIREFQDTVAYLDDIEDYIRRINSENHTQATKYVENLNSSYQGLKTSINQAEVAVDGFSEASEQLQYADNQINQLKNSFLDFFSLTNSWYLLREAIHSAYETVKELDASMTEIAVVSDYTLDEIWSMRKEYSDAATEMGAKTLDLVDATKLYVQQGLSLNEAMEVGIETTKMARIANLDGAEATNLMTAA
jgi:predicted  nucleic acid-binding Zn-ribbon protein